jgi:hypothetical protein
MKSLRDVESVLLVPQAKLSGVYEIRPLDTCRLAIEVAQALIGHFILGIAPAINIHPLNH